MTREQPSVRPTASLCDCLIDVALIAMFVACGIVAGVNTRSAPVLALVESSCLMGAIGVATLDLPHVLLTRRWSTVSTRRALQRFRSELAALPRPLIRSTLELPLPALEPTAGTPPRVRRQRRQLPTACSGVYTEAAERKVGHDRRVPIAPPPSQPRTNPLPGSAAPVGRPDSRKPREDSVGPCSPRR